jgi:hypothetical protein
VKFISQLTLPRKLLEKVRKNDKKRQIANEELDCIPIDKQTEPHVYVPVSVRAKIVNLAWNMEDPLKLFNPHIRKLWYQ